VGGSGREMGGEGGVQWEGRVERGKGWEGGEEGKWEGGGGLSTVLNTRTLYLV
jgi:hypothetical protein